jgi:hypothetical protein
MQSLFDPNPRSQAEVKHSRSPVRLIVFLLLAILGVGGWGVYRYERELERQKQERCDKAHAEFMDSAKSGFFGGKTSRKSRNASALRSAFSAACHFTSDEMTKTLNPTISNTSNIFFMRSAAAILG